MKLLFLLLFLALSRIAFGADGLVAFSVSQTTPPVVSVIEESGILEFRLIKETGEFQFKVSGGTSESYHVSVSMDGVPVVWNLKERGDTVFAIELWTIDFIGGALLPYNPNGLCTVTIDMP